MKTIMIVPELPCKNCHKYEPNACVECFNKNGKKEQVPETFEELKTICKETEKKTDDIRCVIYKDEIDVIVWKKERKHIVGIAEFYYDGKKIYLGMGTGFSVPIEIPRVWSFIKSLIRG